MQDDKEVIRGRMVVEEVVKNPIPEPQILDEAAKVSSTSVEGAVAEKSTVSPVQQFQPSYQPKKTGSPIFWILIPGIFLLGAILGGIVFYEKGVANTQIATPIPTTIPIVTVTPTASPSASVDLTKYSISILNGSGIPGEAGKAKTLLTGAGFKVGTTGNAATYNFTKTIIKAKTTVDANFVSALSTALGKTYVVDTTQTLATSSANNVQVVIGSSKTN